METKPNKYFAKLPIIISLVALATSIYSVMLSRESHHISRTQTLVGKRYEVLLLMHELTNRLYTQYNLVQKILWTYQDNLEEIEKRKDIYITWEKRRASVWEEINEEEAMMDKFLKDEKNDNIEKLEKYAGYYKLNISYKATMNDLATKHLNELEERLRKVGVDKLNKTKKQSRHYRATGNSAH